MRTCESGSMAGWRSNKPSRKKGWHLAAMEGTWRLVRVVEKSSIWGRESLIRRWGKSIQRRGSSIRASGGSIWAPASWRRRPAEVMLAGLLMLVLAGVRVKAGVLVLARRCSSAASACRRARASRRRLRAPACS